MFQKKNTQKQNRNVKVGNDFFLLAYVKCVFENFGIEPGDYGDRVGSSTDKERLEKKKKKTNIKIISSVKLRYDLTVKNVS